MKNNTSSLSASRLAKHKATSKVKNAGTLILAIVVAIVCILPIWLLFVNATRSTEAIRQGISFIPGGQLISNIQALLEKGFPVLRSFFNSVFISFSSTALCLYFSALTAYAFVMYDFKYKNVLFSIVLIIIMMPGQLSLIGFYQLVVDLGLYDTYVTLIIPSIASAATVFFLKQYMESNFSRSIVESARIDGASEFAIFNKICIPMTMPALATMGIFGIVSSWNNYMGPLLILSDIDNYTLPMLVQLLTTDIYSTDLGAMYAGIFLTILPLLVVYAIFAKKIVAGVALGGVKE